ncbi:MAG: pyruvate dehydrogenase (acetyl-transferring), homodimeric type, partial [Moraxella sp.]|nr:pyruvate dehydrogenase (acetyl-transferring), homodimeric type [Moraxella sp.]
AYINTIPAEDEPTYPGDLFMERKLRALIRYNALAMVMRANQNNDELGGHLATFASSATLYETGFNHFWRAPNENFGGDIIYYQGHGAPGMYARSFMEGRLSEEQLKNFRREVDGKGLSSYPHPYLMPDYWQFPTVSMGLGPLMSIYQAHIQKYLTNRKLIKDENRKVWAFLGDGETDEPESLGAISLAGREKLDNLIWVINCNLQRLDGPVRGNGKIIQELESVFRGAGWRVIKVIWGDKWDALLAKDESGALKHRMEEVVDGEYQLYAARDGAFVRKEFFGKYPELAKMAEEMSDDDIVHLNRGGHDPKKVYAAYSEAMKTKDQPTVILVKTVKGYGLSNQIQSVNKAHQIKKLDESGLKYFRDRFDLPFSDEDLKTLPFYRPSEDSAEYKYLMGRREALGGHLPARRSGHIPLTIPELSIFNTVLQGSKGKEQSTTMMFVRLLSAMLKDKAIQNRVVPIVPDEARTFGLEGMFRQLGIYSAAGQNYVAEDADALMGYKEAKDGHMLEEGIN